MDVRAGWVVDPSSGDPLAHELAPATEGEPIGTLCGRYADSWEMATPGVERCQDCQLVAAGPTPD